MASSSLPFLGLDRKAMEEERLARQSKKRAPEESHNDEPPTKAIKSHSSGRPEHVQPSTATASQVESSNSSHLMYPKGVIKRTWAYGFERKNDIKIEEVFQKHDLNIAVLSSFDWDIEWLMSKFDLTKTKLILIMKAKDEAEQAQYRREAAEWSKSFRFCFPPMHGAYSCMHAKLQLLFFDDYMRCVIPSANLVSYDWGETGIMENSVFLIDLPRLPESQQGKANPTMTYFGTELLRFLEAMHMAEDVKAGILKFDFSATSNIAFVHSIAGAHFGDEALKTGYPQLSEAIRQLTLQTTPQTPLDVDLCASSIGSLDSAQVETLYRAIRGMETILPTEPPSKRRGGGGSSSSGQRLSTTSEPSTTIPQPETRPLDSRFRLIFPTRETVSASIGGEANGGTLFLRPTYHARPSFPRPILRDFCPTRPGLLSHNKLIFARTPTSAYAYVGSANLSAAAWGRLGFDQRRRGVRLSVGNWECGVVVSVVRPGHAGGDGGGEERDEDEISTDDGEGEGEGEVLPMSVFEGVVDVPFVVPAERYAEGQVPWSAE